MPPSTLTLERDIATERCELTQVDQEWLALHGVDPSWQSDPTIRQDLNDTIRLGSVRLDGVNQELLEDIAAARLRFMRFIGVSETTLTTLQAEHSRLIPLDTLVKNQRVMFAYSLDVAKIIKTLPSSLTLAPESIHEKMANLTALGLDAAKVVNTLPKILSYAPESVREKVANLTTLGLNAGKVINAFPGALSYALESVREKVLNLTALGLDAIKVINTKPSTLGYAKESVREKMANLTELGLDAARVVNTSPSVIGYAPESVQEKVRFLYRSTRLLRWDYSALDLITTYPAILGFSVQKLAILQRLASKSISEISRSSTPVSVQHALIIPLEKYILQFAQEETGSGSPSLEVLASQAHGHKLDSSERREKALKIAQTPRLGRIGIMYLRYRGESPDSLQLDAAA